MKNHKALSRAGLIVVIAVSLFVCPLATGGYGLGYGLSRPAEARQIEFTPHVSTLEAEGTRQAATLATVGPGQSFEEGDPTRPKVMGIEDGDNQFGYGPLSGDPDLYAVWVTDSQGTHYLIVHKDSELLRGDVDSATGQRYQNGFDKYIRDREVIVSGLQSLNTSIRSHDESGKRFFNIGLPILAGAAVVCAVVTFGTCAPFIALGGAFMVPAFTNQESARALDDERLLEEGRLRVAEADVVSRFEGNSATGGPPQAP